MGILGLILLSSSIVQQFSLQAIRSSVHNLDFLKVVRLVFWSGVVGPGTSSKARLVSKSIHNRAHVRLGLRKLNIKIRFHTSIFLPELVQSSQYFTQFLSAHQTEQGRKQTFKEICPPFLTGHPGGLGPRCDEKIARNVKITVFSPH